MPALVLRAGQEILPGFGFILPAAEAERFAAAVPSARVVDIDANHFTITTHDDFHHRHRCVPARELTPGRSRLGARRGWRTSLVPSARWLAGVPGLRRCTPVQVMIP